MRQPTASSVAFAASKRFPDGERYQYLFRLSFSLFAFWFWPPALPLITASILLAFEGQKISHNHILRRAPGAIYNAHEAPHNGLGQLGIWDWGAVGCSQGLCPG